MALEGGAGHSFGGATLRQEYALQLFRAPLILHQRVRTLLGQSLAFARRTGAPHGLVPFRTRKLKVVLDTRATSWAGVRSRTPTTCWPTGSPSWHVH